MVRRTRHGGSSEGNDLRSEITTASHMEVEPAYEQQQQQQHEDDDHQHQQHDGNMPSSTCEPQDNNNEIQQQDNQQPQQHHSEESNNNNNNISNNNNDSNNDSSEQQDRNGLSDTHTSHNSRHDVVEPIGKLVSTSETNSEEINNTTQQMAPPTETPETVPVVAFEPVAPASATKARRGNSVFPSDELRLIPQWVEMIPRNELLKRKDKSICKTIDEKLSEYTVHQLADLAARFGVVVGKDRSKARLLSIIADCISQNKTPDREIEKLVPWTTDEQIRLLHTLFHDTIPNDVIKLRQHRAAQSSTPTSNRNESDHDGNNGDDDTDTEHTVSEDSLRNTALTGASAGGLGYVPGQHPFERRIPSIFNAPCEYRFDPASGFLEVEGLNPNLFVTYRKGSTLAVKWAALRSFLSNAYRHWFDARESHQGNVHDLQDTGDSTAPMAFPDYVSNSDVWQRPVAAYFWELVGGPDHLDERKLQVMLLSPDDDPMQDAANYAPPENNTKKQRRRKSGNHGASASTKGSGGSKRSKIISNGNVVVVRRKRGRAGEIDVEDLFVTEDATGAVVVDEAGNPVGTGGGNVRRLLLSPEAEAELLKVTHARHDAAEKRAVESHRRDMHLKQVNTVRALEEAIKESTVPASTEVLERQLTEAVEVLREF